MTRCGPTPKATENGRVTLFTSYRYVVLIAAGQQSSDWYSAHVGDLRRKPGSHDERKFDAKTNVVTVAFMEVR